MALVAFEFIYNNMVTLYEKQKSVNLYRNQYNKHFFSGIVWRWRLEPILL